MVCILLLRSRKPPKILIAEREMEVLPEQENLLNYKTQGGFEVDQVTKKNNEGTFFLGSFQFFYLNHFLEKKTTGSEKIIKAFYLITRTPLTVIY